MDKPKTTEEAEKLLKDRYMKVVTAKLGDEISTYQEYSEAYRWWIEMGGDPTSRLTGGERHELSTM